MSAELRHYVYRIASQKTGEYYIGLRQCWGEPMSDPYMGSPHSEIKQRILAEGWQKTVLREFETRTLAHEFEVTLIQMYLSDALCVNRGASWILKPESEAKRRANQLASLTPEWNKKNHEAIRVAFQRPEVKAARKALTAPGGQWQARQRAAFSLPCTIDDVTVYPSRDELTKALGWGKRGARNPNFKYLNGAKGSKPRTRNV